MEETGTQAPTTNEGEQTAPESTENTSTETRPEGQPAEETAPQGAPEKYEFTPLEGQEFDAEVMKVYEETARELNLTNESAQKLLDKVSPIMQKQQQARIEAIRNEWAESSKTDKEFGGDKLEANLSIAKQALDKFGTQEFKKLINDSGLGNNPEVIRFLYRAGKDLAPDTMVTGHKEGKAAPKSFNDFADKLYS